MRQQDNRQWILAERPVTTLTPGHFQLRTVQRPIIEEGQVLVRNKMLSIDPANRAWMFPSPTYKAPVEPGDVMHGTALGEVIESRAPDFKSGDLVEGPLGWQDYAAMPAAKLTRRTGDYPPEQLMSILGITGLSAYFGLLEIGRPRQGETVLVSAAAGAVGSVAAQIARIQGCRVVGIAGGPEKCAWLQSELGLDASVDYKAGGLRQALKAACPDGIDIYFDNTGGDALAAALSLMNLHGRIVCCGNLSQYNTDKPAPGPAGVPGLLVTKRIRMEGFIVMDHLHKRAEAEAELSAWVADGKLKAIQTIQDGLESAPQALIAMFEGVNRGKLLLRI